MKIDADLTYALPEYPLYKQKLIRFIEHLSGKKKIEALYEKIPDQHAGKGSFFIEALKVLEVDVLYDQAQLEKIPKSGPLVILANHPFGILDGLFLCYLGAMSRPNWGILIYDKLCEVQHLSEFFLPISFEENETAININISTKKRARDLLGNDGALVVFPAGGISTSDGYFGPITDLEWKLFAAKIIHITKANVLPVFFHGQNSHLFQVVSQFSLTLRMALVIHELRNKFGGSMEVSIGDPLPYESLTEIKKRQALLDYLRQHVYSLAETGNK